MTADHRSKNTPEEEQQFITQFKEILESECIGLAKPARQLYYVGNYYGSVSTLTVGNTPDKQDTT